MLEWFISSSALILIVISVRALFGKKISPMLRYALWGIVLVRLLLPISIGSAAISAANLKDSVKKQPAVHTVVEFGNAPIATQSYEDAYHNVVNKYESEGIQVEHLDAEAMNTMQTEVLDAMKGPTLWEVLRKIFLCIWIAGIMIVGSLFIYANVRFRRNTCSFSTDTGIVKDNLAVRIVKNLDTPCLFGLTKPVIYITDEVAKDETYLRHTLEHEYTHYLHKDHIWSVLRGICVALHWFNPLVWYAALLSQRDAELACDEATIRHLGEQERAEYGRTLIRMTCRKKANVLVTATTMNASKRGIKERILLIARKPKMAVYTLITVLLIAAIAIGCTFTGAKETTPQVTLTEEEEEQLEDFFLTYDGEGRPTAGSYEAKFVGSTEEYALVYYFGTGNKLVLYRYQYADGQINVLSATEGAYKLNKGITMNHLPLEKGHLYFGTVADARGLWNTLVLTDSDGKEYSCELQNKTGFICVLDSPLSDFCVLNINGSLGTDMAEYLNRNQIVEVSFNKPPVLPTKPAEITKPTETTDPVETTVPVKALEPWPYGEYAGNNTENPPVYTIEGSDMGPLYRTLVEDKICISVYATLTGEYRLHIIPENQEEFYGAFQKAYAEGIVTEDYFRDARQWWVLSYQGDEWFICKDGALYNWKKKAVIPPEAAADLIALCESAVRQVGLPDPVGPEDITQIRSATLRFAGAHTLTDWESLEAIRELLANSRPISSAGCPFNALLTLELNNGKTVTIAVATDSCGAWMSEGNYYEFEDDRSDGSDGNIPFYEIFVNKILRATRQEDMRIFEYMLIYFSWEEYAEEYGYNETVALMRRLKNWISQDFTERKWQAFNSMKGLTKEYEMAYAAMLSELFYAYPKEFALYWRDECYNSSTIAHMLAAYWNTDAESAGETLLAAIPE